MSAPASPVAAPLATTPLHALHLELGARMVPFAGHDMPLQYPAGILAEHRHCRASAALFDVSHMGQIRLLGERADLALETLVPMDVGGLVPGKQRYAFFTNHEGGLLDDLMITRRPIAPGATTNELLLVVNAAGKHANLQHLSEHLGRHCEVLHATDHALLALQGPQAEAVLAQLDPGACRLGFMTGDWLSLAGTACFVTRSGYTGEDGFEISLPASRASGLARELLSRPEVKPAGLGARDTLRLEAGLCLYGHDIDTTTTPVEAGLGWAIQRLRRPGGMRAGGYPGAAIIERQLAEGPPRRRVGLIGAQRMPVREGSTIVDDAGRPIGRVTSGTLAPSVDQAIAMAYVASEHAAVGQAVQAEVRGRRLPMRVAAMPFAPHHYRRA
jgi:aminomethyltransferase